MKKLLYFLFIILLSSCINTNKNKDYTAVFEICRMELSRSPWASTYVLFVKGYLWNYNKDSIWVIPFDKRGEAYLDIKPSYIIGSINGKKIEFDKMGAIGKLDSGECFQVFLFKTIKEKEIPSDYLIDHAQDLKFTYTPIKDSTIFFKDRLDYYNLQKYSWKKSEGSYNGFPDYDSIFMNYIPYKDSSDMHFVNKMVFRYKHFPMNIKIIEDGRNALSLIL